MLKFLLQHVKAIHGKYKTRRVNGKPHLIRTKLNKLKRLYFRERLLRVHIHFFNVAVQLTVYEHASNKISKVAKSAFLFRELPPTLSSKRLLIIYKSFIRRHIDYGDVIYD